MKLFIKYMVSMRCISKVREELQKVGITNAVISLGNVEIFESLTTDQKHQISVALQHSGLEIIDNKKLILIEKIKNSIVNMIHYNEEEPKVKFSEYLSQLLNYDYTYLANVFSETEGITIEHFIINHRIERVKELIRYNELTLTEIAWKLHYSSVAHLSNQFKKVTGVTPSLFRSIKNENRMMLEKV